MIWAYANGTQVISAPYFDPRVKALAAKAYLSVVPGNHHTDNTPFMIPDHIWNYMKSSNTSEEDLAAYREGSPFSRW